MFKHLEIIKSYEGLFKAQYMHETYCRQRQSVRVSDCINNACNELSEQVGLIFIAPRYSKLMLFQQSATDRKVHSEVTRLMMASERASSL